MKQPEALRLADELAKCWGDSRIDEAIAELRRLHEANQAMLEALKTCDGGTGWGDPYQRFDAKLVSAAIKKATKGEQS